MPSPTPLGPELADALCQRGRRIVEHGTLARRECASRGDQVYENPITAGVQRDGGGERAAARRNTGFAAVSGPADLRGAGRGACQRGLRHRADRTFGRRSDAQLPEWTGPLTMVAPAGSLQPASVPVSKLPLVNRFCAGAAAGSAHATAATSRKAGRRRGTGFVTVYLLSPVRRHPPGHELPPKPAFPAPNRSDGVKGRQHNHPEHPVQRVATPVPHTAVVRRRMGRPSMNCVLPPYRHPIGAL